MSAIRRLVAETTWFSSNGEVAIGKMDNSHLLNSLLYAARKAQDLQTLGIRSLYHGRSWVEWAELFRAEVDFRSTEGVLVEAPAPQIPSRRRHYSGIGNHLTEDLVDQIFSLL